MLIKVTLLEYVWISQYVCLSKGSRYQTKSCGFHRNWKLAT